MKKLLSISLFILFLFSSGLKAQKLMIEPCNPYLLEDKKTLGYLFYADKDYTYLTVNKAEKGYGHSYNRILGGYMPESIVSIDKFDKDMKRVASVSSYELWKNDDKLKVYVPKIIGGNFLFLTEQEMDNGLYVYSTVVIDKDFNIIAPKKDIYTLKKGYMDSPTFTYSIDSTNLLVGFDKSLAGKKDPKVLIGINDKGVKIFEKEVIFFVNDDQCNYGSNVLFDNKNIYLSFRTIVKSSIVMSKVTGKKTKNHFLFKYNIANSSFSELLLNTELEAHYILSCRLAYNNGNIYIAGTYVDNGYPASANIFGRYDGHFIVKFDSNDKLLMSKFNKDNTRETAKDGKIYQGWFKGTYFKEDGGLYFVLENRACASYCNTNEIVIYNHDKDGNMLWKKAIEKNHNGGSFTGSMRNEDRFMYSYFFYNNNNMYVLFNESKNNAESTLDEPFSKTKVWDKELYCLSYIFENNGTVTKKSLFNSVNQGCKFQINNVYQNTFTNKIQSLGDDDLINIKYE